MQIFCMSNTLATVDVLYLHWISSGSKPILFIEDLSLYAWGAIKKGRIRFVLEFS